MGSIKGINTTVAVYIPDTGHEIGSIRQINSTVGVRVGQIDGITLEDTNTDSEPPILTLTAMAVESYPMIYDPIGNVWHRQRGGSGYGYTNTQRVIHATDIGTSVNIIAQTLGTLQVFLPDTGHEIGSIKQVNTSVGVYIDTWRQTGAVRVGQIDGSVAVYFSQSHPTVRDIPATAISYLPSYAAGSVTGLVS